MKKISLPLLFTLIISLLTILPLFHSGFFSVHDATQPERVYEMAQALKDGQFPVRIVRDLGYGYGYTIFNFYSPLPYYAGGVLNLLGLDLLLSTKIMFALGILISSLSMYLLAKNIWNKEAGMVAGILYVFAPYHALDIYVRGAVGEFWAVAFLPLVFLSIYKISQREEVKKKIWIVTGGLSLAAVITSHNLTAMMLVPFLLLFCVILFFASADRKSFFKQSLAAIILGVFLSGFYFLPALFEMGFTKVFSQLTNGGEYFKHFIYPDQLWDFPWGFGGSAGRQSGISFKVGKISILLSLLTLILFILFRQKKDNKKEIIIFSGLSILFAVFFTNSLSQPVWETLPFLQYLQFPWRFLVVIVFIVCLLGGGSFYYLNNILFFKRSRKSTLVLSIIIFTIVFVQTKYFQPQFYFAEPADFYSDQQRLMWGVSKISDEYLPKSFPKPISQSEIINKITNISNDELISAQNYSNRVILNVNLSKSRTIIVYKAAFPGWNVYVDNKIVSLEKGPFLSFFVNQGKHEVVATFTNTRIRLVGNLVSLFGIALIGVILLYEKI